MLNVKERLPSGPDFKFLFHFTQVIRVECGWMSSGKSSGYSEYQLLVKRYGGSKDEVA
jgi:hypothetical protein